MNIDEDVEDDNIDAEIDNFEDSKDSFSDNDLFNENLGFDNMGMGAPIPMEKHSDLLKDLTNFAPYLKETINGWLGIYWDEKTAAYLQDPDSPPIMNKKCANWCVSFLKTYARKNNIITHIGKNEYVFLVEDIIGVIWYNIGLREDFGIINSGDCLRICTELQHSAELVLMGAGDGKYNELLSTATQRNENVSYNQNPNMNNNQGMMAMPKREWHSKAMDWMSGK